MRNVKEQAKQGEAFISKHLRADMRNSELMQLLDGVSVQDREALSQIRDAITTAFYMGVAVGSRNA